MGLFLFFLRILFNHKEKNKKAKHPSVIFAVKTCELWRLENIYFISAYIDLDSPGSNFNGLSPNPVIHCSINITIAAPPTNPRRQASDNRESRKPIWNIPRTNVINPTRKHSNRLIIETKAILSCSVAFGLAKKNNFCWSFIREPTSIETSAPGPKDKCLEVPKIP
ncbi:hypothetical protein BB558_007507 [Smittium angustum]|uniref:Uncharacterized protein n=1 Tax=Smittium angustum TaxID=133377 RepID=A0A2U1IUU8_SMIAN|nr:hypothetical protein BB558_007507 [Smittium angustum]